MGWLFLASLANKWLWLCALGAAAVIVALGLPVWFAVASLLAVLAAGAGTQAVTELRAARSRRGLPPPRRPVLAAEQVRDPEAAAVLARADAAAARLEEARSSATEVSADVAAEVELAVGQMREALVTGARQVDRVSAALAGVDPRAVFGELGAVEQRLAVDRGAPAELVEERRRVADGLRSQLATAQRLAAHRALVLERMLATAVGIEGLATRIAEIGALSVAHGTLDTSEESLLAASGEVDVLREALVEAERTLRSTLSAAQLPLPPDRQTPPSDAGR